MEKRELSICCVVGSIEDQAVGSEEQNLSGKGGQGGRLRGEEPELENGAPPALGERRWRM